MKLNALPYQNNRTLSDYLNECIPIHFELFYAVYKLNNRVCTLHFARSVYFNWIHNGKGIMNNRF